MKIPIFGLLLLSMAALLFTGCAETADDPNRVSTIPWNRPEKWEGQGGMGGMAPGSR